MKWAYHIPGKLKISLLLTGVICLIMFNNLTERWTSRELKSAFESMYADRLMAESYILQLSDEIHSIQDVAKQNQIIPFKSLEKHLLQIQQLNKDYLKTQLTEEEKTHFKAFETHTTNLGDAFKNGEIAENEIDGALSELKILSQIQVKEAQGLIKRSGQIFTSDAASSQLEIILLIVVILIVQAILFASKIANTVPKAPPHLN